MRILHVIAEMGRGGAERIVVELAEDAIARGDTVAVVTGGGVWEDRLRQVGAEVHRVGFERRSVMETAQGIGALVRVMRGFGADVVHTHNVRVTAAARSARLLSRRHEPLITTLHGVAPDDYRAAARLLRWSTGLLVACAPAVQRAVVAAGFPSGRTRVITNGAQLEPASSERRHAARRDLALDDRPLVVGIGRLVHQKAWPVFIEAARQIDGVQFVVIGDGELRAELEARAAAAGGCVRFVGPVDDVAAVLGLATCVASSSAWEGLPLSLLEALSLGVPAVATAVDGVADIVPVEAAVLVPPDDPRALAAGIRRVLDDSLFADALGRRARAAAEAWSPRRMLEQYRDLYAGTVRSI